MGHKKDAAFQGQGADEGEGGKEKKEEAGKEEAGGEEKTKGGDWSWVRTAAAASRRGAGCGDVAHCCDRWCYIYMCVCVCVCV